MKDLNHKAAAEPEVAGDTLPPPRGFPLNLGFRPAQQVDAVYTVGRMLVECRTGRVVRSLGHALIGGDKQTDERVFIISVVHTDGTRDAVVVPRVYRPARVPLIAWAKFKLQQKSPKPR